MSAIKVSFLVFSLVFVQGLNSSAYAFVVKTEKDKTVLKSKRFQPYLLALSSEEVFRQKVGATGTSVADVERKLKDREKRVKTLKKQNASQDDQRTNLDRIKEYKDGLKELLQPKADAFCKFAGYSNGAESFEEKWVTGKIRSVRVQVVNQNQKNEEFKLEEGEFRSDRVTQTTSFGTNPGINWDTRTVVKKNIIFKKITCRDNDSSHQDQEIALKLVDQAPRQLQMSQPSSLLRSDAKINNRRSDAIKVLQSEAQPSSFESQSHSSSSAK